MSSELRANEYPRASAILGGLSLVTQLATTATDSVPIANLVVGVVSQIVKLADDIEKRRTALHALAETARSIGESIEAVVSHRKPSEQLEGSLKGLLHVFHAIQVLFAKHRAKRPFFKALSYAFTTAGHIDDLIRELSRASQQFTIVAALDTNALLRNLQSQVEKNSFYIDQCRNLHDCDIGNLELIHEQSFYRSPYKIRYYTVDINGVTTAHAGVNNNGTVFVLRSIQQDPDDAVGTTYDDNLLQMISRHDSTLEKLSTPSNRHRNIAYLYGRRMGNHLTSFTVMKSGYISFSKLARGSLSIEQTWHLIGQIVDALCHLDERDASWLPAGEDHIFLDDSAAPIIGLNNDLWNVKQTFHFRELGILRRLLETGWGDRTENLPIDADDQRALAIRPSGVPVPWSERSKSRVPLRLIPSLNERRSRYLQKALATCRHSWDTPGMVVLLAAASGRTVGSIFLTQYFAQREGQDSIYMYRAEERDEELIFMDTRVDVPVRMKDEFRKKLGIPSPRPNRDIELFISTSDSADLSSMSFRRE